MVWVHTALLKQPSRLCEILKVKLLLQVQEQTAITAGGLMLPESARERPMSGAVVSVGPGKRDKDGSRKAPKVILHATQWLHLTPYIKKLHYQLCGAPQRNPMCCTLPLGSQGSIFMKF